MTKEVQPYGELSPDSVSVGLGELFVSKEPQIILVAYALGSCVALCAHDPKVKVGGLAHILLPNTPAYSRQNGDNVPAKYADRALLELVTQLEALGASRERLIFKMGGGAAVLSGSSLFNSQNNPLPSRLDIGRRNIQGILALLYQAGHYPTAADVGGQAGRTLFFWPNTGKMRIRTVGGEERDY